jgi:hypothetical protein
MHRDLAQTLDATWYHRYSKTAGAQVIAENFPKIIAIFQQQDPLGRLNHPAWGTSIWGISSGGISISRVTTSAERNKELPVVDAYP